LRKRFSETRRFSNTEYKVFGVDLFLILALIFLVLGVVGSLTPLVPGALVSIIGVLTYWWSSGYTEPSGLVLALIVSTGVVAIAFDWLSGLISAKISGVSNKTSIAAGIIGLMLFFVAGPIGTIIGVAATVVVRNYLETGEFEKSLRAGFYTGIGVLGSTAVQFVLTLMMLVVFILTLFI